MEIIAISIFWSVIFLLGYHYAGYFFILKLLAKNKKPNQVKYTSEDSLPTVAVVFAAYNEEKVIAQKIEHTFNTTYPPDKLQVWIGSDNSTDDTHKIVQQYQRQYPNLHLRIFSQRTGKAQIINQLVENIQADILILTDANILFTPTHIFNLVAHFKNSDIGLVGGNITNNKVLQQGISEQETAYIHFENKIKCYEGLLGCMIGAFGASYAIRKELYVPVPKGFISDDFFISMQVLAQGKKAIFELNALGFETFSTKITEEFRRKARYAVGNFQNLFYFTNFWKKPFSNVFFCYFSHKVLRWFLPLLMVLAAVCLIVLATKSKFYLILASLALLICILIGLDIALFKEKAGFKPLRFLSHFLAMNAALLLGFFRYLFTKPQTVWKPTERIS
ncbi:MAG: glycosyltransferase [Bacteroidia bacterium]|nr:glycosyltransferase [Bacteroidia bacterium]